MILSELSISSVFILGSRSGKDSSYVYGLLFDSLNDLMVLLAFVVKNKEVQTCMKRWIKNCSQKIGVQENDPLFIRSSKPSENEKHVKKAFTDIYVIDL